MSAHQPVARDADGRGGQDLLDAAHRMFAREPALPAILAVELARVRTTGELLAAVLSGAMPAGPTRTIVHEMSRAIFSRHPTSLASALADIAVTTQKNFEPAGEISNLLFSRGIHALLAHRVTHALWIEGRTEESLALKTAFGRVFSTDIHPAARFGMGIWLDHGLGFVVGETAIIEDDVSIWHGVTLGSTLKVAGGSRHPRLRRGCTIGAGAVVLGGIEVGEGSVVAAGSVVLGDVAPFTTVAGVPAKPKPRSSRSFCGFPPKQEGME